MVQVSGFDTLLSGPMFLLIFQFVSGQNLLISAGRMIFRRKVLQNEVSTGPIL